MREWSNIEAEYSEEWVLIEDFHIYLYEENGIPFEGDVNKIKIIAFLYFDAELAETNLNNLNATASEIIQQMSDSESENPLHEFGNHYLLILFRETG